MPSFAPEKIYEILTDAFTDPEVRDKLTRVIAEKCAMQAPIDGQTELFPVSDSSDIISGLRSENNALREKLFSVESEAAALRHSLNEEQAQCEKYRDKLNIYCSAFAPQISLYEKYCKLSKQTLKTLSGIFKNNSVSGLFLCGVQFDNLQSLRNFTEQLVINDYRHREADIRILNELYAYLLHCYNSTFSEPVYKLTEFRISERFDDNFHHSLNGKKSGVITCIYLQGCICTRNGKIIRKAFVDAG
ncbi:MAG: hypothetical protein ACI4KF_10905 [Huintestinicola sp.]